MSTTAMLLIVDRSGSMASIQMEAEQALNDFLSSQKELPGRCGIHVVQFDGQVEDLFGPLPLADAPEIKIVPRGMTALLDAIGKSVTEFRQTMDHLPVDKRLVVILTDGLENVSQEWEVNAVNKLINESRELGYEFIFLAANQDAIATGAQMGIPTASSLTFAASPAGVRGLGKTMDAYVTNYRAGKAAQFTDQDRQTASGLTDED
ncbi:hypothetical protein SEA_WOFFORD_100 [Streptomyces phage Wofford]|uniref:VWFA domain-containing protein n=1 Tax=Streptomyces phage Wofford TaxID=2283267 RepID=A0A345M9W1_9CAUD|nr:hypothetical protein HWB78_gp174 [Streptomyces phage Wollford]AXH67282.1 hypothetical protein SEA_WOFFORD_100 [Streptomyces phage Wollford]